MSEAKQGSSVAATAAVGKPKRKKSSNTVVYRFFRNRLSVAGFIILAFFFLVAVFAPLIAPYNYQAIDPLNANQFPSLTHWFGTDTYGRDLFSRMVYGARYSLAIGICAQGLALVVGIVLGTLAGYLGGAVDNIILRCTDIIQAIPSMLVAITVSQALGSGFVQTVFALSVGGMPMCIRMLRATMLTVRSQDYVEAAQAIDCPSVVIMFKHVLPNSLSTVIVTTSLGIGQMIMISAGLSYLGLGIQEPTAEWGAMLSLGKATMRYCPFQVLFPGIAIALLILAFNLLGDGLRDALDPKLRS